MRPALCEEALRLGRILAELAPQEPEVHGLVALMEIQASRSRARVGLSGEPILLFDQNRARWDQLLIRRGLAALGRSEKLRAGNDDGPPGPYALEAAIAACHARARTPAETDWEQIVAFYGELARLSPSLLVELNPCGGACHGLRSGCRPRARRCPHFRTLTRRLPPLAERARRPPPRSSAVWTRRAQSSSAQPASRATVANAIC
jgi:hypothetical protein